MQEPRILDLPPALLAGFSFYGDPFAARDPWSEENEIGLLWARLMAYLDAHAEVLAGPERAAGVMFEVHIPHAETAVTGRYEVFTGLPVPDPGGVPVELLLKRLPGGLHAVFTLQGAAISGDWHRLIYHDWLPTSGYEAAHSYGFQRYDARFLGLERLEESSLDVYIPVRLRRDAP